MSKNYDSCRRSAQALLAALSHASCWVLQAATVRSPLFPDALAAFAQSLCWTLQDRTIASVFVLKMELPCTWNWLPDATTAGATIPPRFPVNSWRLLEAPVLAVAVTVERIAVVVFAAFVVVGAATAVVGDGAVWTVGVAASVVTEVKVVEVVVLLVKTFPPPPSAGVAAKSVTMPKNPLKMSASIPS